MDTNTAPIDPQALARAQWVCREHDESWKKWPELYPVEVVKELQFALIVKLEERLQAAGREREFEIFQAIRDFDYYLSAFITRRPNLKELADVGDEPSLLPNAVAFTLRFLCADGQWALV